jgi:hypothetical protein
VYAGRRLGTAVFSWGATDPYVYEEIRDLLGMVLYVLEQSESPAFADSAEGR